MTASITAHGLTRRFQNGKAVQTVIDRVSLAIEPAELTLIVGPSGSGKSTLLSLLSGLLRPDAGSVLALGQDLSALDGPALERFRLAHCGFVFQGFNLFPALTALENVALPLHYGPPLGRAAMRERSAQALDAVGLTPRSGLRPQELSGGEKQRVAIARALVKQPKLLFADEPTSALDSHNGQVVIDILHRIAREQGTTVLGVTHDGRLMKHADRVLTLEDGRLVDDERARITHSSILESA